MPENNGHYPCEQNEARIVKLETTVSHLEEMTARQEQSLDQLKTDTTEIKTHLARQNGAIPHMQEDVGDLKLMMQDIARRQQEEALEHVKQDTRSKIYWGIAALAGGTVLGVLLKAYLPMLFKGLFGIAILL